jgi:CheY-like chemotaxis protein
VAKQSLLLVDSDARSLRVLEVSLKKAGFNVTTAVNGRDALDKVQTAPPDLIISDTDMPEMDGFTFCEELKTNSKWADIPFIFLTKETSVENKIRGLELGVEDYLTKPIYIKEILTRIRILLQKHQRARLEGKRGNRTRFAGRISDVNVVDLIQTIEVSRKSGLIHFRAAGERRAVLYFREGKVIDAEAGPLQGEDAVYRLLTWSEGEFEVIFRNVRRKDVIKMSSQALLMEGMRRLDEWGRLLEQLPPLETRFEIDADELAHRLAELPDELNSILKLFDARKNLMEIIDASDYGDLECLEVVAKLYFEGLIVEVAPDAARPQETPAQAELPSPEAEVQEHMISQEELDITDVDVAPQPQTSLVEAAIGAATPVEIEPGADEEASDLDVQPGAAERMREAAEGVSREPGAKESARTGEPESQPASGASSSAMDAARSKSPGISVVSSEGAEVAVAAGEVHVLGSATELTDPAREIITIVPQRAEDEAGAESADQAPAEPEPASVEVNFDEEPGAGMETPDASADEGRAERMKEGMDEPGGEVARADEVPIETDEPGAGTEPPRRFSAPRIPAVGPIDASIPETSSRGRRIAGAMAVIAVVVVMAVVLTRGGDDSSGQKDAAVASRDAGAADARVAVTVPMTVPQDAAVAATVDAAVSQPDARVVRPPPETPPEKGYKEYLAEAGAAYRRKRHQEALDLLELALAERSTPAALTLKADILLDKGDETGALEAIDEAVKRSTRHAKAWLIKGQVHLAREEYGKARPAFEKYLELQPRGRDAEQVRTLLESLQ